MNLSAKTCNQNLTWWKNWRHINTWWNCWLALLNQVWNFVNGPAIIRRVLDLRFLYGERHQHSVHVAFIVYSPVYLPVYISSDTIYLFLARQFWYSILLPETTKSSWLTPSFIARIATCKLSSCSCVIAFFVAWQLIRNVPVTAQISMRTS